MYTDVDERINTTIMIVDDMPLNLQVLGMLLQGEEYRIIVATDGSEALNLAAAQLPDLILLDIEMPGISGIDVCVQLKMMPETREIPVIFLTARHTSGDIVTGFESGAVDYVTKPFNRAELLARVKNQLELRRSREMIRHAYRELEQRDRLITDDLNRAREIQDTIMAVDPAIVPDLELGIVFRPFMTVGGDLIDLCRLDDGRYRILVADANGHGIQAALVTMLINSEYEKIKRSGARLSEILGSLNTGFYRHYYRLVVLFTAVIMDIDCRGGVLRAATAGHPQPCCITGSHAELLGTSGSMIGVREDAPYVEVTAAFNVGDTVMLYTDGLFEDLAYHDRSFQTEMLRDIFATHARLPVQECAEAVERDIVSRLGAARVQDDLTLVVLRRRS